MDIVTFAVLMSKIKSCLTGIASMDIGADKKSIVITTNNGAKFTLNIPNPIDHPDFVNKLGWDDAENCLTYDGELIKVSSATTKDITATTACGAISVGQKIPANTNLQTALETLLVKEESPAVVLAVSMSDGNTYDTIREKGVSVTATCKATITKKSYDVSKVQWTSGIIVTESSVATTGGTFTRTLNVSSDVTITCKATDIKGLSGTGSKPLTFVNPIYLSYIDESINNTTLTEDLITGGTKILKKKATFNQSIISDNKKVCFAYDSSYGNLTSIKDVNNGFENLGSFVQSTINITTANGTVVPYTVYLMDAPVTIYEADNFLYQLKW